MQVLLTVTAGPHAGKEYAFDGRDSFLVGRSKHAHFQLSYDDPYFSRRHFVVELNPPRCRVLDLGSRNGVYVNGVRVPAAELKAGDEVKAGHTTFKVSTVFPDPDAVRTLDAHAENPAGTLTIAPRPAAGSATQAASQAVAQAAAAPVRVPGYELGPELGRGGMGVVYRATRAADGRPAAVKRIVPAVWVSDKAVERFLREARILGDLRHPNVVEFLDAGAADGALYIAMELVDGPDVERAVRAKGPMPVGKAVRLAVHAAHALEHAHAAGYVHRDVKPSNLLVGGPKAARVCKLADFGLARAYEASRLSGLTLNGDVGGTPAFMPPEQVTHYRDVKPAADQYSLAATLYFLLTASYLFDLRGDVGQKLVAILTADPVPLRDRRADVPAGLAATIHKALAKEPDERFPTLATFRRAVRAFA